MLELKKDKGIDYVLGWKSKGVYTSKLKPLYTAFLHSIKFSGYRNNHATKIVNVNIFYDLDTFPNNSLNIFKFKKMLVWCH